MKKFLNVLTVVLAGVSLLSIPAYSAEQKKEGGGKEYVNLDPLILPVIDNYGLTQIVSMVVSIEVDGIEQADKVKAMSPRLKDAYIQNIYGIMNESEGLKNGVVQVKFVKDRLNKVTHEVMGAEVEKAEVLLQMIQQRPI